MIPRRRSRLPERCCSHCSKTVNGPTLRLPATLSKESMEAADDAICVACSGRRDASLTINGRAFNSRVLSHLVPRRRLIDHLLGTPDSRRRIGPFLRAFKIKGLQEIEWASPIW